jgi:preprotein translocase subunit YajC
MKSMFNFIFLAVGLLGGAAVVYFLMNKNKQKESTQIEASVVLNKIERVFKVVTAEGHFSEVFDYSQTATIASILPSTKKALLIVKAKVLMGYDFKKCVFEIDSTTGVINIKEFPEAEILSMEPDIKYYNLENGLFNKFDNNDMTLLQAEAKKKLKEKVAESNLPQIAQSQMQNLLLELKEINNWQLTSSDKQLLLPSGIKN